MNTPQQTVYALPAASVSVARMQAKAAQLSDELRQAQARSISPLAGVVSMPVNPSSSVAGEGRSEAGTPKLSTITVSAPSVFRRLSAGSMAVTKAGAAAAQSAPDPAYQAVSLQCQKLEAEVQLWKNKHTEAIKEMDRHQDSYMRREEQLKSQLAAYTQHDAAAAVAGNSHRGSQAGDAGAVHEADSNSAGSTATSQNGHRVHKPATLQDMQHQMLEGLDELLQRQHLQMRTEESQQLRQFRGRLAEIEAQLAAYRQAAAASQDDWMGKTVALREELTVTQEIASKLDAMYKLADEEAANMRVQFKAQEDDRQHLIKQMLGLKREVNRLKQENTALQDELDQIMALALEAEDAQPASQFSNSWAAAAAHHAGASSSSSLAAAITEVANRRGSAISSRPQSASVGSRPGTASQQTRQQQHLQQQQARPWSAAGVGSINMPTDPAAVEARMIRYSHVIHKLQKLLEIERRQVRQLRNSLHSELGKRTELQSLLLSSLELAKQQYRDAEAAHCAQQEQLQQQQTEQQQNSMQGPRGRPWSAVRLAPGAAPARPPSSINRQLPSSSRPAGAAAPGLRPSTAGTAGVNLGQQLDQTIWEDLLSDLLSRQQVLELVLKQTFPVVGADELSSLIEGQRQQQGTAQHIASQHWQQQHQRHEEGLGATRPPESANVDSVHCQEQYLESGSSAEDNTEYVVVEDVEQQQQQQEDFPGFDLRNPDPEDADHRAEQNQIGAQHGRNHQRQDHTQYGDQRPQQHDLTAATSSKGGGLMLPGFPIRQPLHHTRLQRPLSAQPASSAARAGSRPSTVAAATVGRQSHNRPQTAITSLHGSSPTGRPSSGSKNSVNLQQASFSRRPATAAATVRRRSIELELAHGHGQQWSIGADRLVESFLSGGSRR